MALEVRDNRESPAVNTVHVLAITLGFTATAGLIAVGLHVFYRAEVDPRAVEQPLAAFPIPEIQPNPTQDHLAFLRRQTLELAGYAWVDRERGRVHVPIARAMALVAARGDAGYDPPEPGPSPTSGQPPDGAPRARPTLAASPYGSRP